MHPPQHRANRFVYVASLYTPKIRLEGWISFSIILIRNITLAYFRIPSYLAARSLFRASDYEISLSNSHSLILYQVQSFPSCETSGLFFPSSFLQVLWPLLTSHNKPFSTLFQHVCEISHGKVNNFHSMYPHHLHPVVRVVFGHRFMLQTHPNGYA